MMSPEYGAETCSSSLKLIKITIDKYLLLMFECAPFYNSSTKAHSCAHPK